MYIFLNYLKVTNSLYLNIASYINLPCLPGFMAFSPDDGQDWLEHVQAISINI
jgi:ferritin